MHLVMFPWWAMCRLRVDTWLVCPVNSRYKDMRSRVWVGDEFSEELGVVVGANQDCPEPAPLNHCFRGSIQGVPYRLSMGAFVCR